MEAGVLASANRITYSCVRCAERKVKCDRQSPCGACVKHAAQCVYRIAKAPRKRHKRAQYDILNDRVKQYEALLNSHGIDHSGSTVPANQDQISKSSSPEHANTEMASQLPTPESLGSGRQQSGDKIQLLYSQERSKLVDNTLWTRVVEEIQDPNDALDESTEELSDTEDVLGGFDYILGSSRHARFRVSHPSLELVHQLWEIFIENVDPLTKIVHVPSLRPAIHKATKDLTKVPAGFEALMFAIYSMSITSLKNGECQERFGETREILLSRYISATKAALVRAKFMGTMSLVVLQAVVFHLMSIRDRCESRSLWTLTGVAMRIAESMGLNRDGASLGLPPFESELRRRIWWQLKSHDWRTAELAGLPKFQGYDTSHNATGPITNCNDDELYPGMLSPATDTNRATDVCFVRLRSELGTRAGKYASSLIEQRRGDNLWDDLTKCDFTERDKLMYEMAESIEANTLSFCDPSQPLQLMTMLNGRGAIHNVHFMIHHPRRWADPDQIPESEKRTVWSSATKLLELFEMMRSHEQLQRFAWHASYFMPWYAFIHVLDTLRANPLMDEAEKSWQLIQSLYGNDNELVSNTNKLVHVGVGNLCLKAWAAREAALTKIGKTIPPTPEYINRLRQQREAAKAKRQQQQQQQQQQESASHSWTEGHMASALAQTTLSNQHDGLDQAQQSSYAAQQEQPGAEHINNYLLPESDSFWLADNFDNNHLFNGQNDMTTAMDTDFMLAQDIDFNDTSNEGLDWSQWDNWIRLASVN